MTNRIYYNGSAIRITGGRLKACLVALNGHGKVLHASGVTCLWSGTSRFHRWFMDQWPCTLYRDGGQRFYDLAA
ncbi:MAG: hypothetical protein L0Z53_15045 [Acidobacteriales bacterium]|nr:hypothetical protein [Terriglobales bacterium]